MFGILGNILVDTQRQLTAGRSVNRFFHVNFSPALSQWGDIDLEEK